MTGTTSWVAPVIGLAAPSSPRQGAGGSDRRTAGPAARDVLAASTCLGPHRVRRPRLASHRVAGEDVGRILADKIDVPIDTGHFIIDNCRAVTQLVDQPPHTVMHGDAHPGNVYFRNGQAGLLDWQAVRRGHPGRELADTLVSMTTVDRQAHQRELLDQYRRALAAAGGPHLDSDELWDRYRHGAQYPCVATLIVAGAGGMQAENIAMEGLRRSVAALEDLDTVGLLEKSL